MLEILIMNNVKYNVIPIGIKTTTPAIKLFLIFAKIDFLMMVQTFIKCSLSR